MDRFPRAPDAAARGTARRAATPPALDGRLAADCWRHAEWSPRFVDLVSGEAVRYDTRAAILWDDAHLYLGFRLEEPHLTATLTERDAHVWLDDDVEVFVAGPDAAGGAAYYELEVNALNTVYEVLMAWDDAAPPAGLSRNDPQAAPFDGVGFRHPRGGRTGFWGFDLPGLRTAVHVDEGRGWSAELALPWAGLAAVAGGRPVPPQVGDEWRIALSRFNTDRADDSGGWAWSPHGVWDSHVPELFPRIRFAG